MVSMLNDNPVESDLLGYEEYVKALSDIVVSAETPFTLGIFSGWGFGKTSLMKMIHRSVGKKGKAKTLWLYPWKYEDQEQVWKAFITELLTKIAQEDKVTFSFLREALEKLTNLVGSLISIDDLGAKFFEIWRTDPQFLNKIEQVINESIAEYLGKTERLIIFIDDLDRCLPEKAIKILEAIKLFFDHAKCVFVIGLDKKVIEQGIELAYGETIEISGLDYIEKIIQLPFHLPTIREENLTWFIEQLTDERTRKASLAVLKYGSNSNPRRIKRFLNIYGLLESLLEGQNLDNEMLAKVIMIQLRFPRFYTYLQQHTDQLNVFNNIIKMDHDRQKQHLSQSNELSSFFDHKDLIYFLKNTQEISCSELELIQYFQFTDLVKPS